ncbi:GlxA family transcriptional regulator [Paraburkholderia panacisoli]|nr:DJ-1/PfpI family protein [Paraburkholderia panacisoli]
MTNVALLAFSGAQSIDVAGPMDVFAEANRFLLPESHYKLEVLGIDHGPLRCSNGVTILADRHFSEAHDAYDLLLVAGGPELVHQEFDPDVYVWLRHAAARAQHFGSICSGAFILARAGLLDGKTATIHGNYAHALASVCPTAQIKTDRLYVQDGRLYTSAGVSAGIDLSLYMLTQEKGNEVALNVAKRHEVFMRRAGGLSQFTGYLAPYRQEVSPVTQVQQYVLDNLKGDLSTSALASVAKMSLRNFARVFTRDAKISPAEFVENARMSAARSMLENTRTPLKRIADASGFNDPDRMRKAFQRRLGISPLQYRQKFRAPGP